MPRPRNPDDDFDPQEDELQPAEATALPDLADWIDETGKNEDEMNLPEEAERGEASIMNDPGEGLSQSATAMISAEHDRVRRMLQTWLSGRAPGADAGLLAEQVCAELDVHAQVEEELFYPAMRDAAAEETQEFVDESLHEHARARYLVSEVRAAEPGSPQQEERLQALADEILPHMEQEETLLLPLAEEVLGDELIELGSRMLQRKEEILAGESLLPTGSGRIDADEDRTGTQP